MGNWFSVTKPSKFKYQLDLKSFKILRCPSQILRNLKYLRIFDTPEQEFIKFKELNKFKNLQILEIRLRSFFPQDAIKSDTYPNTGLECRPIYSLELPKLKALLIEFYFQIDESVLLIDTPDLHSLSIYHYNRLDMIDNHIRFKYPLTIKYVQFNNCYDNIVVFSNLERLDFYFEPSESRWINDIQKLEKLNKLRIVKKIRNSRLNDLIKSKRDAVEIFFYGVRIKDVSKFNEMTQDNPLKFQIDNYGELDDDLDFVWDFNYSDLISLLPATGQPSDLFRKYNNIQYIEVNSMVKDGDRLLGFIKECYSLFRFKIKGALLCQEFYDKLPDVSALSYLQIFEKGVHLNFGFIMRMDSLLDLETNFDILADEHLDLNRLKNLKQFIFEIKKDKFEILKDPINTYSFILYKNEGYDKKIYEFSELIGHCEKIRNGEI